MSEILSIMKYLGIPYKHTGRTIEGLDCWGLIKIVYKDVRNVDLWDIGEEYPEDWSWKGKDLFMENYRKQWERVKIPLALDVILLNNGAGIANHAGVMLNDKNFIHCTRAGVIISRITDRFWKSKITGFFRYKKG
jgi:cell wall-associated NlpC family hydrolase